MRAFLAPCSAFCSVNLISYHGIKENVLERFKMRFCFCIIMFCVLKKYQLCEKVKIFLFLFVVFEILLLHLRK